MAAMRSGRWRLGFPARRNTEIERVGTAAAGEETLRYVAVLRPDVIVMDMRLPGQDGAEVTAALKDRHPEVKVLILTAEADGDALRRALAAGADGFMLKTARPPELASAIMDVAAGRSVVAPSLTGALFAAARGSTAPPSPLSDREREVLQLLANGKTNKEIASSLFVS